MAANTEPTTAGQPRQQRRWLGIWLGLCLGGLSGLAISGGCQPSAPTDRSSTAENSAAAKDAASPASDTASGTADASGGTGKLADQIDALFKTSGGGAKAPADSTFAVEGTQAPGPAPAGGVSNPAGGSATIPAATTGSSNPPTGGSPSDAAMAQSAGGSGAGTGASDDVNRLIDRLQKLYELQQDVQSMEQFNQIQSERLEKATQVLALEPSYEYQVIAIKSQIDALSWQDGMQQPQASAQLEELCQRLQQSDNRDFRRMGMLGRAGGFMRRFSRDPSRGVGEFVESIRQAMAVDYDDFELATELAQAASAIFTQGKREEAIQVMTALRDALQPSQEAPIRGIVDSLQAQIAMAEVRLDQLIAAQIADETKNLPQLEAGVDRIVASGVTVALYNEMTPWMQLFERQACYRSADVMAAKLEAAFRQLPVDSGSTDVLTSLQRIRQRMGLIGESLQWTELVDLQGQPFDPQVLADKVVLVTFFSTNADKNLRDQLQFESKIFEELREKGFAMVGVNVDASPTAARDFFGTRPPRWVCLQSSNANKMGLESTFAQQVVADRLPYRLLINRAGEVVHLGVPVDRLGRYITTLMQGAP